MERLLLEEVDHKTAALLLYALQTASMNLKRTSLEPALPTQVVIDRESVANRPIGATAWSRVEGREYDDLSENDLSKDGNPGQPMESIVRQSLGTLEPKALRGSEWGKRPEG